MKEWLKSLNKEQQVVVFLIATIFTFLMSLIAFNIVEEGFKTFAYESCMQQRYSQCERK